MVWPVAGVYGVERKSAEVLVGRLGSGGEEDITHLTHSIPAVKIALPTKDSAGKVYYAWKHGK